MSNSDKIKAAKASLIGALGYLNNYASTRKNKAFTDGKGLVRKALEELTDRKL